MSGNNNTGPVESALAQLIRGIMVGIIREALTVLLRAYIFEVQRNQRAAEEEPRPQPVREALPRPQAARQAPYRARRRLRAGESEEEEEDQGYAEPEPSEDDS